jgi:amino acid transporter
MASGMSGASMGLFGAAVVLLLVAQFVPWAEDEMSFDGGSGFGFDFGSFSFKVSAYMWNAKMSGNGDSETTGWYESDADDSDGIMEIRAAIPIILASMVAFVAALAMAAMGNRMAGAVGGLATVLALIGFVLYIVGVNQLFEDLSLTWHVGFYLAIVAMLLGLLGTVLSFVGPGSSGARANMD